MPIAPAPTSIPSGTAVDEQRLANQLLVLAGLGIVVRLLIAWMSYGTNDAVSFWEFAVQIDQHGLLWMYRNVPLFNHPPLIGYWALAAMKLTAEAAPERFPFIFKLPVIAADVLAAYLLWRIGKARSGPKLGATLAAVFCWSPVAILVSGYHCNTDNIYAALCLLSVFLMGIDRPDSATSARGRFLLAGLALGAAINVKLIPVLLIPPLLLSCPDWRSASRFAAGLAIAALPYLLPVLLAGEDFYRNVLAYRSQTNRWGLVFLLVEAQREQALRGWAEWVQPLYLRYAPWVIILLVIALGALNRRWPAWNRATLCALCLAIFLILAPGFGAQYLVILLPLLFIADFRFAVGYSLLAGTFMLLVYASFGATWANSSILGYELRQPMREPLNQALDMGLWYSHFAGMLPLAASLVGLIAWVFLAQWTVRPIASAATAAVRSYRHRAEKVG